VCVWETKWREVASRSHGISEGNSRPNDARLYIRACLCACVFVVRGGVVRVSCVVMYTRGAKQGGIICFFLSGSVQGA